MRISQGMVYGRAPCPAPTIIPIVVLMAVRLGRRADYELDQHQKQIGFSLLLLCNVLGSKWPLWAFSVDYSGTDLQLYHTNPELSRLQPCLRLAQKLGMPVNSNYSTRTYWVFSEVPVSWLHALFFSSSFTAMPEAGSEVGDAPGRATSCFLFS